MQTTSDTVYVVNFWATWCKPCVEELPAFVRLDSLFRAQHKAMKVVLVSFDFHKDLNTRLRSFLKSRKIQTMVVLFSDSDMSGSIDKISSEWSGALPATLMVCGSKHKKAFFEKSFSEAELQQAFQTFIGD